MRVLIIGLVILLSMSAGASASVFADDVKDDVYDFSKTKDFLERKMKAEQGDAYLQFNIGSLYLNGGNLMAKNIDLGLYWLRKSADNGWQPARSKLAFMHLRGIDVAQNTDYALKWFTKFADEEKTCSQLTLGKIYLSGKYVTQDIALALHWLTKAAEKRVTKQNYKYCRDPALYLIGLMHANGHGVPKDYIKGRRLITEAIELGHMPKIDELKGF